MPPTSDRYGLSISNIPVVNLRAEFYRHRALLNEPGASTRFRLSSGPIETPYLTWYGMPHELLTWMVVRVIMGVEAYLPYAVGAAAAERGVKSTALNTGCRSPFSLSRKAADAYYNRLPELVHTDLALKRSNGRLWAWINGFYPAVRNPLFHGSQLDMPRVDAVAAIFNQFGLVYAWVDSWSPPPRWWNIPIER